MCGICGLVSLDGATPPDPDVLAAMSETLVHRGPDSEGAVVDGPVGLAARRLSIIDLEGGDQPIANEDGTIHVVQNGEIYNHRALRRDLERRGHRFATACDTEVLVHLYEERGPAFVEELRGMFAIALWDSRARRLVLGRDRFGIKPLLYRMHEGVLSFASELKAILRQPGFAATVDLEALGAFLAFNAIPAPLTIFEKVRKLPAGHVLVWDGGEPRVSRYARPRPADPEDVRDEPMEVLAAELRDRLRNSVRAHLVSDVPVGVMLSGGVDSSALTALASQESSERVMTFSIGFEESSFDELSTARLVAERYGTDHHELVVRPDAIELLPKLVDAFDEPFADSSALPTYLVSELASRDVKVALSGEGGDELFGGYYTYVADAIAPWAGRAASVLRPAVEALPSSSSKASFDYRAKRFVRGARLPSLERHHAWKEIFSPDARAELLSASARHRADPLDVYRERYAETEGADELARLQDVDLGIYLVDDLLVKTDRASMAHSLEARVPFLDTVVADLALALRRRHKVMGFAKKRLLRRALAPLVPRAVVHGRKQGFSAPIAAWLRGELEPFAREVLSPQAISRQGYFRPEAVTRLIDDHVSRREDLSRQIWGLLSFTLWCDRHGRVAGPVAVASPE
ncbi:MAG TPA: asparagine synthase (glutamine-hydrolyzing) [Solirubrobacterales bacterium]|nr:asparagine synthase (glutamine-hydrolyzing) [Solirubrobacterales bacterium]